MTASGQPSMFQESLRAFLRPILKYLDDEAVTEIMVNGPEDIWVERRGELIRTDARFTEESLAGAARNIAQSVGRILNDERPRLDARLPDGSRIHVILAPVARAGTTMCIRKFFRGRIGIEKLIELETLTPQMAHLIRALVRTKLNVMVSGGTSSGKTTLLNVFSSLIPAHERIVTIEDSAELQLHQEHLVSLESRQPDKFGKGEVPMSALLDSALRLRPDRVIVGEVRGGEAFNLIQAMNTGHGGTLATLHANTPTDTLRRLEALCLMSSVEMPMIAVRAQVASAVNAVVCCERGGDGKRRVVAISEVLPLDERGEYRTQNLFVFAPTHRDGDGRQHGFFAPTGVVPTFLGRLRANGFSDIDDAFFDPSSYGLPPPPSIFAEKYTQRWAPSLRHRERGAPDPEALVAQMARADEVAQAQEAQRAERLAAGSLLEGYSFDFDGRRAPPAETTQPEPPAHPPAASPPRPPEAEARPRVPTRAADVDTRPSVRAPVADPRSGGPPPPPPSPVGAPPKPEQRRAPPPDPTRRAPESWTERQHLEAAFSAPAADTRPPFAVPEELPEVDGADVDTLDKTRELDLGSVPDQTEAEGISEVTAPWPVQRSGPAREPATAPRDPRRDAPPPAPREALNQPARELPPPPPRESMGPSAAGSSNAVTKPRAIAMAGGTIEISGELLAEVEQAEQAAPTGRAPLARPSALPPGKRPLPAPARPKR